MAENAGTKPVSTDLEEYADGQDKNRERKSSSEVKTELTILKRELTEAVDRICGMEICIDDDQSEKMVQTLTGSHSWQRVLEVVTLHADLVKNFTNIKEINELKMQLEIMTDKYNKLRKEPAYWKEVTGATIKSVSEEIDRCIVTKTKEGILSVLANKLKEMEEYVESVKNDVTTVVQESAIIEVFEGKYRAEIQRHKASKDKIQEDFANLLQEYRWQIDRLNKLEVRLKKKNGENETDGRSGVGVHLKEPKAEQHTTRTTSEWYGTIGKFPKDGDDA